MEATLQAQRWAVEQVHIAHMARQKAEHDAPPADAIEARARRTINRHEREERKATTTPATLILASSRLGEPGPVSPVVQGLRKSDAQYHLLNAQTLARKLKGVESVEVAQVETGEQVLDALAEATAKFGAIKNLVVYGHGGAGSLYMRWDAGFYQTPETKSDTPDERMRALGSRTVGDLEKNLEVDPKSGVPPIEFAPDSTIIIGACNCGFGTSSISRDLVVATSARVIAAGRGAQPNKVNDVANRHILQSDGGWFKFEPTGTQDVKGKRIGRDVLLDPTKYIRK